MTPAEFAVAVAIVLFDPDSGNRRDRSVAAVVKARPPGSRRVGALATRYDGLEDLAAVVNE